MIAVNRRQDPEIDLIVLRRLHAAGFLSRLDVAKLQGTQDIPAIIENGRAKDPP